MATARGSGAGIVHPARETKRSFTNRDTRRDIRVAGRIAPSGRRTSPDTKTIEVGKLAELTVLTKDIMKIPEPDILTTTCAMTVIGGEIVYEIGR
ncbi:MAG: Amidohydrolase family [Verrucomicrobiota bacterium]|jgi:hypothetical protein